MLASEPVSAVENDKREERSKLRARFRKRKLQKGIEDDFYNFPSARGSAKTELKSFNQKELPIIWQLFFLFI
ncbi:hypothetical protein C2I17_05715 [Niallia circulans]|nr:hypothetical protein C2I17_05715 [Niallia circulans]